MARVGRPARHVRRRLRGAIRPGDASLDLLTDPDQDVGANADPDVDLADWSYTFKKIRGGEYSIKELARMMHDIGASQWGTWPILTGAQGGLVSPISLREMLGHLQNRPEPYTSFREALQQ